MRRTVAMMMRRTVAMMMRRTVAMDSGMMWGENNADEKDEDKWGRRRRASSSGMSNAAQWAIAMGAENNADQEDKWGRRRRRAPAPAPVDNSAMDSGMMR